MAIVSGLINTGTTTLNSTTTVKGPIYFGSAVGSEAYKPILVYSETYPQYGICYNNSGVDKLTFSASGNAGSENADLCINGNGNGTVTIRGNNIWHAGNLTKVSLLTNDSGYLTSLPTHNHDSAYMRVIEQNNKFAIDNIPSDLAPGVHKIHISGSEYSSILCGNDYTGAQWLLYFHPHESYDLSIKYRYRDIAWRTILDSTNSSVSKDGETLTVTINGTSKSLTNTTYNFSGASFTSGQNGTGAHNCNNIKTNGHWYYTSNGPTTTLGATTNDGALYSQAYSASWVAQIAQDYRNGNLFTRGLNNGTWSSWRKVAYIDDIPSNFLTEEVDTLATVTTRGNSTTNSISVGGLTSSGNLTLMVSNQHNSDLFIRFKYSTTDLDNYSWRIGYLGSGSGNENRLVFLSNGNGSWKDVLTLGLNDYSAVFSGAVTLSKLSIPTTNGGTTRGLGTNGQVLKTNGTTVYWASDSDANVKQTVTTSSNTSWRPIILGYSYSDAEAFAPTTTTAGVLASHLIKVKPSTGDLCLYSETGDSPHLIFQRGTSTDGIYDWDIYVEGGTLKFRRNNSGNWTDALSLYVNGDKITTPWPITSLSSITASEFHSTDFIMNDTSYIKLLNDKIYIVSDDRLRIEAETEVTGNLSVNGTVTASSGFIGNLTGNAATATKLKTARTISLVGAITGSGTFDGNANLSITTQAAEISGGYLNIHPENSGIIVPFIHNDLAFLNKKGGSYSVYSTTSTNYTAASLTQGTLSISGSDNMFDGSPSYAMISTTGSFVAVIDMTLHKHFTYSNQFYIDFGSTSWRTKGIAVYVMNSDTETTYTLKDSTTTNAKGHWYCGVSHSSTNSSGTTVQGFNRLRVVLSNFNNTSSTSGKRIAQIGLISYGSSGVTETFISRGGCTGIYGNLLPKTNNTLNLGSSSQKWANVYATTFSGNATTATKLATGRTLTIGSTGKTFDGSNNVSWTLEEIGAASDDHTHSFSDITPGNAIIGDGVNYMAFRSTVAWRSGMYYQTNGDEAMVFANTNNRSSWIFAYDDPANRTTWTNFNGTTKPVPSLQIRNQCVTINKLMPNTGSATTWDYNLDVGGKANATELYENGTRVLTTSGTAASARWLNLNTELTYGASGLNYFNINGVAGNTKANNTPTSAWYHIIRMNHANAGGYLADIAVPLNDVNGVWWRQIRNGSFYGWYKILDSNNYDDYVNTTNFPGLNKTGTVTSVKVGETSYSPSSGVVSLPAYPTNTNYYHTRAYSSGLKISTGTGVSDMYVPEGTTSSLGVVKQHTAANCTSFTSDAGATTPAAVKKAVGMFGVLSGYGTCSTAGDTAAKGVSIADDNWRLVTGCIIGVKFTNSNSASSVTLNVNSTGAKNIWYNNAKYTGTSTSICGYANRVIYYMYDGTYWVWLNMGTLDGNNYAYVRQYQSDSTNSEFPLLFRYDTIDTTSYLTKYTRYANTLRYNPNTTLLTVPKISLTATAGLWITGKNHTSPSINISTTQQADSYYPILNVETLNSHYISLGSIGDLFGFLGYHSSLTSNGTTWRTYWNVADGTLIHTKSIQATGGFFQTSDATLKIFKEDIKVDFDKLKSIPKKYFYWKSDDMSKLLIGTSAQEVQKYYPELVSSDENGTLSVAYDKLSILALKSIDELYEMIISLKSENEELRNRINSLNN